MSRNIERIFAGRGLQLNELTRRQAWIPTSCRVIQNLHGTAPLMWFEKDCKVFVAMPGVPYETRCMLPTVAAEVEKALRTHGADHAPRVYRDRHSRIGPGRKN